jgi:hypothetical protein
MAGKSVVLVVVVNVAVAYKVDRPYDGRVSLYIERFNIKD